VRVSRADPAGRVAEHHRTGDGLARIGYPIGIRTATVKSRTMVSPGMLRLTLAGPELAGFHTYQADDHVKVVFADPDGTVRMPTVNAKQELDWPLPYPATRKYTIRRYDPQLLELDLDFVVHDGGLASDWAVRASPGDPVVIAGPPGAQTFPHNYEHYVFAIDATALPAVARWLDESPQDVSADVVVEVTNPDHRQYPLPERPGVRVRWLIRPVNSSLLADTVGALDLPPGRVFLFAAGEAGDIKPLRRRRDLDKLVTGYWKRGVSDEDVDLDADDEGHDHDHNH